MSLGSESQKHVRLNRARSILKLNRTDQESNMDDAHSAPWHLCNSRAYAHTTHGFICRFQGFLPVKRSAANIYTRSMCSRVTSSTASAFDTNVKYVVGEFWSGNDIFHHIPKQTEYHAVYYLQPWSYNFNALLLLLRVTKIERWAKNNKCLFGNGGKCKSNNKRCKTGEYIYK